MDSTEIEAAWAIAFDMETTGLNAEIDVPLEVGMKIIDKDGFVFTSQKWLIFEEGVMYRDALRRARENEFVNEMHTKNKLFEDLYSRSNYRLGRTNADYQMAKWVIAQVGEKKLPMLGNSVGSLDRPFTLKHFPNLNATMSYRNIDISTIKEICKAHNPELFENLCPIIGDKTNATHRVMEDIDACLLEFRAYIENFFFIPGGGL